MHCWPLSVCLSVCPVSDLKLKMEGRRNLIIGRKEAHDTVTRDPIWRSKGQTLAGEKDNFGTAQLVCFIGMSMSNG